MYRGGVGSIGFGLIPKNTISLLLPLFEVGFRTCARWLRDKSALKQGVLSLIQWKYYLLISPGRGWVEPFFLCFLTGAPGFFFKLSKPFTKENTSPVTAKKSFTHEWNIYPRNVANGEKCPTNENLKSSQYLVFDRQDSQTSYKSASVFQIIYTIYHAKYEPWLQP